MQTLWGVLGAAAVVSAVILLVDFVETSRDIATRVDISALRAFWLTLLRAPMLIQETLPFIMLFGVLWTFFRLNRQSELIVLRASGVSAWRILAPPLLLAVVIGLLGATALNPLGAATNARFELARERLLGGRTGVAALATGPVWLREPTQDGYAIITADGLDAGESALSDPIIRIYEAGAAGSPEFARRITASRAVLSGGFWSMTDAVEHRPGEARVELGDIALPTTIGRQALFERARSPGGVSFWRLPGIAASAQEAGLSSRAYELRWQALLSQPLMLAAATLLAVAATLRLTRLGGTAAFAIAGGLAGFVLYFMQELMINLGSAGAVNPVTAAWTAPALFSLAGLFFIASTEDG
ncbi:permease [Marinicauda salina]|uniref:Permease n=2 Tax=Marinicauda salina TaxID=2135793 RepID=A0A2U2BUZ4_9PROT|nr:permease [Marinicauda salina]